jgi:hypothetical protein
MDDLKEPDAHSTRGVVLVLLRRGLRWHSVLVGQITQFHSQCVPLPPYIKGLAAWFFKSSTPVCRFRSQPGGTEWEFQ